MKLMQLLRGGNVLDYPDRRRAPRTFADRQVILAWKNRDRVGYATVLDWSVLGLRIRHSLPLQRRNEILVITPDQTLEARIVWLSEIEDIKEAGLLLTKPIDDVGGF